MVPVAPIITGVTFVFTFHIPTLLLFIIIIIIKGHAVAHLVEALRHNLKDRGCDSRWCHWNFSLT
jgi:hypothetical protein